MTATTVNTEPRYRIYQSGNPYSTSAIEANTLVDLAEATINSHSHTGTEALLWDGDIAHYCSRKCLRDGLATLDSMNLWLIATYGQQHQAKQNRRPSDHTRGHANLIIDTTDSNLRCDECHDRIGEHFGDCMLCKTELIISDNGARRDESIVEYYDGSSDKFVGLCHECSNGEDQEGVTDNDLRDRVLCGLLVDRYGQERFVEVLTDDVLWSAIRGQRAATVGRVSGQTDLRDSFGMVEALTYAAYAPTVWVGVGQQVARDLLDAALGAESAACGLPVSA